MCTCPADTAVTPKVEIPFDGCSQTSVDLQAPVGGDPIAPNAGRPQPTKIPGSVDAEAGVTAVASACAATPDAQIVANDDVPTSAATIKVMSFFTV